MGADHADRVTGLPFLADRKRDNGGSVACEIVLAPRLDGGGPRIPFLRRILASSHVQPCEECLYLYLLKACFL